MKKRNIKPEGVNVSLVINPPGDKNFDTGECFYGADEYKYQMLISTKDNKHQKFIYFNDIDGLIKEIQNVGNINSSKWNTSKVKIVS